MENLFEKIIVFDTSSLGRCYDMLDSSKETMIKLLDRLQANIWLPGHVMEEFQNKYKKILHNPIQECYSKGSIPAKNLIINKVDKILNRIEENKDYHPHISDEALEIVKSNYKDAKDCLTRIENALSDEFQKRIDEIKELEENDRLLNKINTLNHGEPLKIREKLEIMKEGDLRFKYLVPPGFKDENKGTIQAFGDLFIWKQIIEQSKEKNQDVIFVLDDKKSDWWEPQESENFHPSLIREFKEETGQEINAYHLDKFVEENIDIIKDDDLGLHEEALQQLVESLQKSSELYADYLISDAEVVCDRCGSVNYLPLNDKKWVLIGSVRKPGIFEKIYRKNFTDRCCHCGSLLEGYIDVHESEGSLVSLECGGNMNTDILRLPTPDNLKLPFEDPNYIGNPNPVRNDDEIDNDID